MAAIASDASRSREMSTSADCSFSEEHHSYVMPAGLAVQPGQGSCLRAGQPGL